MAESLRILILEDNPADAELIRLELQEAGITFTSEVMITEGEYLQAIQDYCPDLILSDYDLPTYNGALALAEARKRCPDTPFILVTGAVTEDRAIDILTQGAKDYVLKNRLEQRLVPAVKRALAEAEEHQARRHAEAELREANRTLEERVKTRTAELEAEVAVRKKIADALQMSERRERERAEELAIILDAVPTPVILVHDPDSAHMTGNRSADELLRQQHGSETSLSAPPEVKPRHFKAFKGGRELKPDELPAQRAARGEQVKDFEFSLVFNDGATRYLLGYGTPLLDKQQRPRGAVHVLVDITERKLAEDALKLNAAIMETVAEGIFLIGLDDNIIKWTNRKLEQLFGYGPGEMVGMHVDKVNAPTKRTPTETRISIVDVLRQTGEWHGEIENIRKDGTHFWCHIHVSLFNHPEFGTVMVSAHTDITERKHAEDKLRESEKRYRLLAQTMLQGVVHQNAEGEIIAMNPAAELILGKDREQFLGSSSIDTEHHTIRENGEQFPGLEHPSMMSLQTGLPVKNVVMGVFNPKLGAYRWVNVDAVPVFHPDDSSPSEVYTVFEDITDRRQAEIKARADHDRLLMALEATGMVTWELDIPARSILYSDNIQNIVHGVDIKPYCTLDELMPLIHPEDRESLSQALDRVIKEGTPFECEYRVHMLDGTYRWILGKGKHVVTEGGKPVRVLGLSMDITDRKQTEEALLRLNTNLEESVAAQTAEIRQAYDLVKTERQRLYDVLEMLPVYVVLLTPEHHVPFANRFFRERFGEAHGKRCYEYLFGRTEPCDICETYSVLKTGKPHHWEWLGPDGRNYDVHDFPFNSSDGASAILEMGIDVTEIKLAEAALKEANEMLEKRVAGRTVQLEEANKELESFSYSVSHDLRAPLRAIDGFSRMLLRDLGDKLNPEDARKLHVISRNSEKMGQLIDDLLNLSRTGRVEIQFGQLNIKSVVEDTWREIRAGYPGRNVELIIGDLPPAKGDLTLLRQVFSNLIDNAVKFTKNRENAVIEVIGFNAVEFNTYCVRDNGAGFDMKYYGKLFEVFRRLHNENQYEGTGVGLAIVKKIIDRHGGRISAESKLGEGATFYFTLPAVINPQE